MARKRMIDPSLWEDENFGKLSPRARILFIGLFSNADDEGRIRANDPYIRSTIFMYDDLSLNEIKKIKAEVISVMKHAKLYTVSDNEYIYFDNWATFQKQREDRIQPSSLPSVDDGQMTDKCQADDGQMSAQVKLSKVKLSKVKDTEKNSKNSHTPCTKEELQTIADELQVDFTDVEAVHETILTKIEEKTFSYKTIYRTLQNWVKRNRDKGWIKKKEPRKVGMNGFNYDSLKGMRL